MPVIVICGPRQSGKTTLVKEFFKGFIYANLEDPQTLLFAQQDPKQFLSSLGEKAIIDEVQRLPSLLSFVQVAVDSESKPITQFVLTGSANFSFLESITQTLAGRAALITLLPFSHEELAASGIDFATWENFCFKGGYPPLYSREINIREWMGAYIGTYVERDVRSIVNIRDLSKFQNFLRLCAGRVGQPVNFTSLGSDTGVDHKTIEHWLSILEASYIVYRVRPFYKKFSRRMIKTPKLYFYDTALVCSLLEIHSVQDLGQHFARGNLFENMCFNEIKKISLAKGPETPLYFWQETNAREVDCIYESAGNLKAVEMKSSHTMNKSFFDNIESFKKRAAPYPVFGIVIYGGEENQKWPAGKVLSWKAMATELSFS